MKKCKNCLRIIISGKEDSHKCDQMYCSVCTRYREYNHKCFMQLIENKILPDDFIFIFYDLECTQDRLIEGEMYLHEPVLCVAQQSCHHCMNDESLNECEVCGVREHVFTDEPIKEFVEYLLSREFQKRFEYVRVLSHNGKRYDNNFILRHILNEMGVPPNVVMNGNQLLYMSIPETNVSFIDSLSYLPMPLSALPKAFGLPSELAKSYFPHFFNTKLNQNYVGPYPDPIYYGADSMKTEDRKKFLAWYENQIKIDNHFDLFREMIKYCKIDVSVLRMACMKFRSDFVEKNSVCPLLESITIAGSAMTVFRKKHLRPDTIGIEPRGGYRYADNQSRIAIQWLLFEEQKRGIIIQHAGRGREVHIPGCGKVNIFIFTSNK